MELPEKACESCETVFKPWRRDQRCCSRACIQDLSNKERDQRRVALGVKVCEKCATEFEVHTQYGLTKQRFCSISCSSQKAWDDGTHPRSVEKVKRRCRVCKKVMELNPSLREVRFTCSLECRGKWQAESGLWSGENNGAWKGGTSAHWKAKARERDDYTCQVDDCDVRHEGNGTHAHHKLPVVAGGTDDLDNLITFCSHHHQVLEHQLFVALLERFPKETAEIVAEMYGSPRTSTSTDDKPTEAKPSYKKRWRDEQRAAGNCVECSKPAIEGQTLCKEHRDANRARHEKWKQAQE
jgi:hypothetical protein